MPPGYTARVLIAWGDPVSDGPEFKQDASNTAAEQALQRGMHNDSVVYFPINGSARGLLVQNNGYAEEGLLFAQSAYATKGQRCRCRKTAAEKATARYAGFDHFLKGLIAGAFTRIIVILIRHSYPLLQENFAEGLYASWRVLVQRSDEVSINTRLNFYWQAKIWAGDAMAHGRANGLSVQLILGDLENRRRAALSSCEKMSRNLPFGLSFR